MSELSSLTTLKTINLSTKLADISAEQAVFLQKDKKYKHIPFYTDSDGLEKSVTEYVCPDGSVGYQAMFKKMDNKKIFIKSVGYGKEADSRTFDWQELILE